MRKVTAIGLAVCASLAACHDKAEANRENFTQAIRTYLEHRGDLCLAKYTWPIDVPVGPAAVGARDTVQMPVLEKLGLVTASDAIVDTAGKEVRVKRYELTDLGRKSYIARPGQASAQKDLCAAHLSLDKIVSWDLSKDAEGEHASVSYTYRVDAPSWARDEEAQRVFPAVARVLAGAGSAELKETLTLTKGGWVAKELLAETAQTAASPKGSAADDKAAASPKGSAGGDKAAASPTAAPGNR
jgi:hypothetical protein